MQACGITRLSNAPDWQIHITIGDSLLFGPNGLSPSLCTSLSEDSVHIDHLLRRQTYSVVVGNPPYITVQDAELRKKYRGLYRSCARAYQVSVPFTELFFDLADKSRPGYVGMIVSNGFMKRSFGKPLIERLLPKWDMTHVMDTAGVYLPGHGTATAILIGRNRHPIRQTVRVVRGIRGEREAPNDPANAPVWREICEQLDNPGYHGRYVSIADAERETFHRHPWSIGGGGAAELKLRLDEGSAQRVKQAIADAGFGAVTREYELFSAGDAARRHGVNPVQIRTLIDGAHLRDWSLQAQPSAIWPYAGLDDKTGLEKFLWPWRAQLRGRTAYGISQLERGQPWYEYSMYFSNRYLNPISLVCAEIATHNHFVLDRGAKVFNCTALLIKLAPTATELDHIGLAGILNSSVACFWLRQVCFPKRGDGIGRGIATETWEFRFDFAFAKLFELPLPTGRTETIASAIQSDADQRSAILPAALVTREVPTRASVTDARDRAEALRVRMIALQEELDWHVYHLYGLLEESLTLPIDQVPPVHLGERAFEILMARAMESDELQTEWFARHGSTPRTTIPEHWPKPYRALVQRRLDTITSDRDIALIEQPEYKRRWNLPPWEELEQEALRNWLLDRLEDSRYWPTNPPVLTSVARLADAVRHDAEFRQVAELYRNRADFDLTELIEELAAKESVPFLPVLRYKEPCLRKRADWEGTWQLQRREDAGEKVEIPVPPKYEKDDFLSGDYWRLRGKLDVPKERFISYSPLARDADKSLVLSWAGYDHGQQALALAGYYYEMRAMEAWDAARLTPILAGLQELQPWLDQWHNEIDPERQQRLNKFIRGFFEGELAQLSLTAEQVRAWRPSAQAARAGRRKKR